jgi:hypothetical protein
MNAKRSGDRKLISRWATEFEKSGDGRGGVNKCTGLYYGLSQRSIRQTSPSDARDGADYGGRKREGVTNDEEAG